MGGELNLSPDQTQPRKLLAEEKAWEYVTFGDLAPALTHNSIKFILLSLAFNALSPNIPYSNDIIDKHKIFFNTLCSSVIS